jgi:cobalt/nickel transport system ATP-binding protein
MSTVISTHDLDFAYGWADEVLVMQAGRLLSHGAPEDVLLREEVHSALGATPLVADIARSLSLIGIDLRDKGYSPRSKSGLLRAINAHSRRENVT